MNKFLTFDMAKTMFVSRIFYGGVVVASSLRASD